MSTAAIARTWPFWAPSELAAVEAALDLGAVTNGTVVVDLGCGDGQVLLAAARRGAVLKGIEADPDLAAHARTNLAAAGVSATIVTGDLFDPAVDLDGEVLFTYLAPATLQRLLPRLVALGSRTLVAVDFDVPGLACTDRRGPARRYTLPGERSPLGLTGWPCAGTLVAATPGHQSLSCLDLVHRGGPCGTVVAGAVAEHVTALAGADTLDSPGVLAVDLRLEPRDAGTVGAGVINVTGAPNHPLFVVYTDDDEGMWELTDDGIAGIRGAMRRSPSPATLGALLDAAHS